MKPIAKKYPPASLSGQIVIAAGVLHLLVLPISSGIGGEIRGAPSSALLAVLGLALLTTVAAYMLWSFLLQWQAPLRVASLISLVPAVAAGLAKVLFNEPIGLLYLVGLTLSIVGMRLLRNQAANPKRSKSQDLGSTVLSSRSSLQR
jgi:drug/metabolite transporter (DMT)-like permease